MNLKEVKGQVTFFIIAAIVIVAGIILFFAFRGNLITEPIPANLEPVYNSFLSCLQDETKTGIDILEAQAGYIYVPDFSPGSAYMPFSNQLDFLGTPIPYWYYVSGNNIKKEQVPSQIDMEKQIARFVNEKIRECNFDKYYDEGFQITLGKPDADVSITNNKVTTTMDMDLQIGFGNETVLIKTQQVSVDSSLGELYSSAKEIYDYEQSNLFLEKYGLETLRYYAPVDGVEFSCSPLTWNANDVFDEIQSSIETNTFALKTEGGNFDSSSKDKYFVVDLPLNQDVNFVNSKDWPSTISVSPSEGNLLIASPIGNQQGLGVLGFCYTPYHFVYDLKYPVLIQVSQGEEVFQFPVAVVIQGNNPRNALNTSAVDRGIPNFCEQSNVKTTVNTFDANLNRIDANISFECSTSVCNLGTTSNGELTGNVPQCVNGNIIAKAQGYREQRETYSSVHEGFVNVILDRLYTKNVEVKLDNSAYSGNVMVSFVSDKGTKTIVYPEQKTVDLSEGQYQIVAQFFRNSTLNLPQATNQKCVDVPQTGILGFLGGTRQKCYNIDFPSQVVSNALSGGGKQNYYIIESQLSGSDTIEINAQSFPLPTTIDALQRNYLLFEEKGLEVTFK